jgi:hypothetical protein
MSTYAIFTNIIMSFIQIYQEDRKKHLSTDIYLTFLGVF